MALKSWFNFPRGTHFSLANLPFGIISHSRVDSRRPAVAVGDHVLDLEIFTAESGFRDLSPIQPHSSVFSEPTLNAFAALGRPIHAIVRKYIQSVFLDDTPYPEVLKNDVARRGRCLIPMKDVTMHMPMRIGDYTDFFAGLNHAYNCGVIFRGPENALQPNYKYLPVGYHGRASSVVVSGTPIRRPSGQILADPTASVKKPIFSPCKRLDMELELAAFVCKPSTMGEPIPIEHAADHIFGVVLMNDWSARDIQAWEYVPLGPFNAKNFGTSISPWIVLADALEPFRTVGITNDTENLEYLKEQEQKNVYDIKLEVECTPAGGQPTTVTRTNARNLLFSFPQMLAHHSITGCPFNVGDLIGSGTISGTEYGTYGSLLEQTDGGKHPIKLQDGTERLFIEDGDCVSLKGFCGQDQDALVGFGDCTGTVNPVLVT
ncbi:MAG: hypothetical protein M1828_006508 [Chrysothrix sp. TS-e1954]|nr:MAG: hypothetical protein M1828_006508 [Chrysothrix sp. TS-e1954]